MTLHGSRKTFLKAVPIICVSPPFQGSQRDGGDYPFTTNIDASQRLTLSEFMASSPTILSEHRQVLFSNVVVETVAHWLDCRTYKHDGMGSNPTKLPANFTMTLD